MKKIKFLIIAVLYSVFAFADEGMWLPFLLKQQGIIDIMQKKGCKLSADDIFSTNKPSLKDAVVQFGGGCTGEIISPYGLVLTNYHCGAYYIQYHSSVQNDYIKNGFWAYSYEQELPNPGLKVKIVVDMIDVSEQILKNLPDNISEKKRSELIENQKDKIIQKYKEKYPQDYYEFKIKPFFSGNMYVLIIYKVFKDVRLVGAPPSDIGKFGGDTDNWIWPRHTGDFSLFRIYVNKNNEPAEYSADNVPYKPKKFFKVSVDGVKKGQFTLLLGFPGSTDEYVPSYYISLLNNIILPLRIKIRTFKLNVINTTINKSDELRIKYIEKQSSISNGWKKWQGVLKGFDRLKLIEKKKNFEKQFINWTKTDSAAFKYQNLLDEFKKYYSLVAKYQKAYYLWVESFYYSDLRKIFITLNRNISDDSIEKIFPKLRKTYKDFDFQTEKQLFIISVSFYQSNVDDEFKLKIPKSVENYASELFENSILTDTLKLLKSTEYEIEKDELFQFYYEVFNLYNDKILPKLEKYQTKIDSLQRLYMKAQMQMQPNKKFYPDANFTLRVSFGNVEGYQPKDAVVYKYYTTFEGIIEKYNTGNYDYPIDQKLLQLYQDKDYQKYKDADGTLHIAFIATNHTTGGNSGSPVIDGKGNLIGVNFDRVWEATMSDYIFDKNMCRNITLDIRYVLFIIDKYANAKNILNEIQITKN